MNPTETAADPLAEPRAVARRLAAGLGDRLVGVALFGSRARSGGRLGNDWDLFVVTRGVPGDAWDRDDVLGEMAGRACRFMTATQEDFEGPRFPSIFLDIGLDGIVLHEQGDYLTRRLARIRQIIRDAGLLRGRDLIWRWRSRRPKWGKWAIDWEGYHELP